MRVAGNSCLLVFFFALNIVLALMGIAIFGCGIYLFVLTKEGNIFNICFMGTGGFIFGLALCSYTLKKSHYRLRLYTWILMIAFFTQLMLTVLMIACRSKLVKWAVKHAGDGGEEVKHRMNQNVNVTLGIVVGSTVLTGLVCLFGCWYRRSGDSRTEDYKERLINEERRSSLDGRLLEAKKRAEEKKEFYRKKYRTDIGDEKVDYDRSQQMI